MLHLNQNMLRAAMTLAAKNDTRHYLESVRIEPGGTGRAVYVATDGHVLGVFEDSRGGYPLAAPVTLPRAAVENALKLAGKKGTIELDGLNLVTAGGTVDASALKDDRYPDWRAVWPAKTDKSNNPGDGYIFNPALVARAAAALGLAKGLPPGKAKEVPATLAPNESRGGAGLLRVPGLDGAVVIMPQRVLDRDIPSDWTPTMAGDDNNA